MTEPRTLIVGIGSPHGDDQIGWRVADAMRSVESPAVEVREASTPSQLLDWLDGVDRLIVCDACQARRRAPVDPASEGAGIHRWRWPTLQVSMLRSADSHSFGLPQVLQLAERLGRLPQEVIVFGIEGRQFDAFASLSPDVELLVGQIAAQITDESGAGPVPAGHVNSEPDATGRREPALPNGKEAGRA